MGAAHVVGHAEVILMRSILVAFSLLAIAGCAVKNTPDAGRRYSASPCIATDGHPCSFNIADQNTDASTSAAHPVMRIMPCGDSNTQGPVSAGTEGAYRIGLWTRAQAARFQIDFVGDQNNGPGYNTDGGYVTGLDASLGDHNHEGLGGYTIETWQAYYQQHQLGREYHPDVLILQLGTNDITQGGFNATTELTNYAALVDEILSDCAGLSQLFGDCRIIITTIPPQHDTSITNNAIAMNVGLRTIAASRPRTMIADLYSAVAPYSVTNFYDDKHLNSTGQDVWAGIEYAAIRKWQ